jgi:putative oxidoreductase
MSLLQTLSSELHAWEWLGVLFARLAVGLLFLLSGEGKLFRARPRQLMQKTLEDAGIAFPHFTAVAVSAVEFICGALLLVGALMPLACLMLGAVMLGALVTTRIRTIPRSSVRDWLAAFLYLPEVLYLVILVWLFFSGPGPVSLDQLLAGGSV